MSVRSGAPPRPVRRDRRRAAPAQDERSFLQQVRDAAKAAGWAAYHSHDSRHSPAGFPDLVLCRPPWIVFAELKRDGEVPTAAQEGWLVALRACGLEAYVWMPEAWPDIVKELTRP